MPHSTVFLSSLLTLRFQLGVICDQIHGHISISMQSVHTSTNQQNANVHASTFYILRVLGINHAHSIFLFFKRQRKRDKMTVIREKKSFKRGNIQLLQILIIMYTPNYSCCGVYLSQIHSSMNPVKHLPWLGYMAAWHALVIWNCLRVIWNVHMFI